MTLNGDAVCLPEIVTAYVLEIDRDVYHHGLGFVHDDHDVRHVMQMDVRHGDDLLSGRLAMTNVCHVFRPVVVFVHARVTPLRFCDPARRNTGLSLSVIEKIKVNLISFM